MKIGFTLPQFGDLAGDGARAARFAAEAERAGADSLWVGDRLFAAVNPRVGYQGGTAIPPQFNQVLDPFTLLAVAATATERVLLGTNVLVAPLYRPALLARSLTTIDVVSGGRLLPGLGIGWSPEEYEAADVPFSKRGARLDETLDALEALWTTDPVKYEGIHVMVPEHRSELKPVQRPRPPIYLAAFSPAGLERIGRRADGWLPGVRAWLPGAAGQLLALRGILNRAAEAAGRDPGAIDTIVRVNAVAGTPLQQMADATKEVNAEAGVEHFILDLMYLDESADASLDTARRLLDLLR